MFFVCVVVLQFFYVLSFLRYDDVLVENLHFSPSLHTLVISKALAGGFTWYLWYKGWSQIN